MLPPRCPNCGCAATGPALHGTPLVLCPVCWTVVDPTAPPPAPPAKPKAAPVVLVETDEHEPLPPRVFDLARLPPKPPRVRGGPGLVRSLLLFLALVALVPGAGYGLWLVIAYYPSFRDADAPGGEFTLAFPGDPYWHTPSPKDASVALAGPLGHFTRHYRGDRQEVYAVSVSWCRATTTPRDQRDSEMLALTKAGELARANAAILPGTARLGQMPGYACADFEKPPGLNDGDQWRAGRVIVEGDRCYILTVKGPDVKLGDWRVKRFVGSFRVGPR